MTLRSEIMERIRKMPIVSDLKSRRFFKDTTPETCHILEVFLSYLLGEDVKVNSIEAQKHGYQRNGRERIADIDIDISGNIVSDHVNQPKERSGKITKYCVHVF